MSIPVTHEELNGVQVLTIGTDKFSIEEGNVEEITQKLLDFVVSVPPQIVINMEHVDFYGSSFIESLFRVWNRIKESPDGRFGIANLQQYCREILKVTNLDSVWPIFDDLESAAQELKSTSS